MGFEILLEELGPKVRVFWAVLDVELEPAGRPRRPGGILVFALVWLVFGWIEYRVGVQQREMFPERTAGNDVR